VKLTTPCWRLVILAVAEDDPVTTGAFVPAVNPNTMVSTASLTVSEFTMISTVLGPVSAAFQDRVAGSVAVKSVPAVAEPLVRLTVAVIGTLPPTRFTVTVRVAVPLKGSVIEYVAALNETVPGPPSMIFTVATAVVPSSVPALGLLTVTVKLRFPCAPSRSVISTSTSLWLSPALNVRVCAVTAVKSVPLTADPDAVLTDTVEVWSKFPERCKVKTIDPAVSSTSTLAAVNCTCDCRSTIVTVCEVTPSVAPDAPLNVAVIVRFPWNVVRSKIGTSTIC
jgi:hypothetical protein